MGISTPELSRATGGLAGERGLLPLSDAQRAVWLDLQRLGRPDAYQVGSLITIKTELDFGLAREAVRMVVARHDSLRLRIDRNEPIQWISDDATLSAHLVDVSGAEDPAREMARHVAEVHSAGFALGDEPLYKAHFIKAGPADWRVLLIVHHLIADGIAFAILQQQWLKAYAVLSGELDEAAAGLERSSYVPFINDDVAYGASKKAEEDLAYWRGRLSPLPELLFEGRPRPEAPVARKLDLFTLDAEGYAAFTAAARRAEATSHRAILALAALALSRRYGQSDFALGMALHRRDSTSRTVLGMIAGLIPVRCTFDAAASLQTSVAQVSKVLDQDLRHARTPIDTLGRAMGLASEGRTRFFDAVVTILPPMGAGSVTLGGMPVTSEPLRAEEITPLALYVRELDGLSGLTIEFSYDPAILSAPEVERLRAVLGELIAAFSKRPTARLSLFDGLGRDERVDIDGFSQGEFLEVEPATLHAAVARKASEMPDALALVSDDGDLTYGGLDRAAARLAERLLAEGITEGTVVGVAMSRSLWSSVALLGILKAGAVYLPLDPQYPAARLEGMIQDADAKLILVRDGFEPAANVPRLVLSNDWLLDGDLAGARLPEVSPEARAYIIYTSGSTGRPKGVAVSHAAAVNLAFARLAHDPIGPGDRVLAAISTGFDVSIGQLLLPLIHGAAVVVSGDVRGQSPQAFWEFMCRHKVSHVNSVPSFFEAMLAGAPAQHALKQLMLGGEGLSGALAHKLRQALGPVRIVNMYGPTETCIDASAYVVPETGADHVAVLPIGRPLPNYTFHVLNSRLEAVGIGGAGELFIGGAGLAEGYVGQPELTAERFIEHPLHGRLYRTGDRAAWREDGEVLFLGRLDQQVKIRGNRIELGEIEQVLLGHEAVAQAAVVARPTGRGDLCLVAYAVAAPGQSIDLADVRAYLGRSLPEHMIPAFIETIPAIPLTPNGKLDHRALPAPQGAEREGGTLPSTPTELLLARHVAELLKVSTVYLEDSFFSLGGHSLLATQLAARVRSDLNIELPLRLLFEAPRLGDLARRIDEMAPGGALTPIATGARPERLPLSLTQERIWFVDRLQQDASYNIPVALDLKGTLDVSAVARAIETIAQRHEALRTRLVLRDGEPQQIIDASAHVEIQRFPADEASLPGLLKQLSSHRFDLSLAHPFLVSLIELAPAHHVLALVIHHTAFDGWSAGVFYREFAALYTAYQAGSGIDLPPPSIQYADFALWQRKETAGDGAAFWKAELEGAPPVSSLPVKDGVTSRASSTLRFELAPEVHASLQRLADQNGASLFMVYHAALAHVLSRATGQDDVVIGTAVANRSRTEFETAIGCFVNTIPLRTGLKAGETFVDLLARVRAGDLAAFAHQDVPFEEIVHAVQPSRSMDYSPIFQVMLVLQNAPMPQAGLPGLAVEPVYIDAESAKFDLTVSLLERQGIIEFTRDRFEPAVIARFAAELQALLTGVAERASRPLGEIELLSDADKSLVLGAWARAEEEFPKGTLDGLFAEQVQRAPDAVAVIDGDRTFTYAEIDRDASRVARWLVAQGVAAETIVGIKMRRSVDTIVAFLGILKAGGAYLPLDPAYPADRLAYIAENAGAKLVLESLDGLDADVVVTPSTDANRLAYVIYTSGTTGLPKGVAVSHVAPVNLAFARKACHDPIGPGDRVLAAISVGFDVSVGQLLLPLLSGATVVVAGDLKTMDTADFWGLLSREGVTHINSVPSFFDAVLQDQPAVPLALKRVMLGGEPLSGALVARIREALPGIDIVNMYGPTEACIDALYHVATGADLALPVLPIGQPLSNYRAYILDRDLQPVAPGVPGELWLAGPGLARGYINAPELTAARFVDGFAGRMYRTGDLARWRSDGSVEFLGRVDQQVKIRGFRVEPGEIAAVIMDDTAVAQAHVMLRDGKLVAYVVTRDGAALDADALRQHVASRLPDYMVPAAFAGLSALPLNANGKIDTKALPKPEFADAVYVEPRTETEKAIAGYFAELLGLDRCGASDNFFDLGGHSLMATRLVSKIRALGVTLPLKTIFEAATVEALARAVDVAQKDALDPIVAGERPAKVPLSYPQERIWFVDRLQQDASYNIPVALELKGQLDAEAAHRSLEALVHRHEALRTRIVLIDGEPQQVIDAPAPVALQRLTSTDDALHDLLKDLGSRRFDLATDLPFAFSLIGLEDDRHVLALVLHHAAFDGWSAGVFYREFVELYAAFTSGRENPLPPLAIQYADFALWQRGQTRDEDLKYWIEELKDAPPRSELPGRDLAPGEFARVPGSVTIGIDATLLSKLAKLGRSHQASMFMVLHAAFSLMLARWNGQSDIVIGTVVANRRRAEVEAMVGCFVNTLPLRTRFERDETFGALLKRVSASDLSAFAHQDLPFEQLFAHLGLDRSQQHAPVFQAMFILQNTPQITLGLPSLSVAPLPISLEAAKFDLMLVLEERAEGIHGALEFAANRFEPTLVRRFVAEFQRLLEAVAENAEALPFALELIGPATKAQIMGDWNAAPVEFPKGTLDGMFSAQATSTPQALAIIDRDGREISYGELDRLTSRLAAVLAARGVGPERVVGVRMERSAATIISMLAILKAGGAYLPLDPNYPEGRLAYMIEDAGAVIVLEEIESLLAEEARAFEASNDDDRLAYIIYTSGTTGRPKGVAVPHRSAVNLVHARSASYDPVVPGDRVLAVTSVSFDMSIEQMLFPLLKGATVVVAPDVRALGGDGFWQLVKERAVTHIDFVPSFLDSIFPSVRKAKPLSLKRLMLGGEAVSGQFLARIRNELPGLEVVNVYGPTETCIDATFHVAQAEDTCVAVLPIGRPLPNYTAFVLDQSGTLVGPGIAGELFVGGRGLARGYVNAPELTAERFVETPFGRLYRTGDRARWREDGTIEFLGRGDKQIKIRGFRVELGEIAAALEDVPGITHAVVVPRTTAGQTRLVAYLVGAFERGALRDALASRLPEHMIPAAFVSIDAVPLNSNGKLDISALPDDDAHVAVEKVYVAPEGEDETALQEIWQELLGSSPIGRDENFFEIGGQSLTALRLIHQINVRFGVELPMRALFERPTIAGLAAQLRRSPEDLAASGLVPLQTRGKKAPLFCIHPGGGHAFCYFPLTRALPQDRPVYGIQARGLDGDGALPTSIEEMAADYARMIAEAQPEGDIHLLGMSLGGLIAFEVAHQLKAQGRTLAMLTMMDTTIPEDINVEVTGPLLLQTLAAEFGLGDLVGPESDDLAGLIERARAERRLPPGFTPERVNRIAMVFWNMVELQLRYQPRVLEGEILSIRAKVRADAGDLLPDWSRYATGPVEVVDLDCAHNDLISDAQAPAVAAAVLSHIERHQG